MPTEELPYVLPSALNAQTIAFVESFADCVMVGVAPYLKTAGDPLEAFAESDVVPQFELMGCRPVAQSVYCSSLPEGIKPQHC